MNYHGEYMLFRNDAYAPPLNASRYTDHRSSSEDGNFDARRQMAVEAAINQLDV